MKIRELKMTDDKNQSMYNEFNHLRIKNLEEFLSAYTNNLSYYDSPFSIIANLEEKIKFQNDPEEVILCSFKPDGDVIFRLENLKLEGNLRLVTYSYETFVS